jgi:NAD(P)H dehydrogenase (quinone)
VVYLDLDQADTMAPALEGIDRLFMVTGYTIDMLLRSKDLLNAVKRAGVKHVVHLGACGNDDTQGRAQCVASICRALHRMVGLFLHPLAA